MSARNRNTSVMPDTGRPIGAGWNWSLLARPRVALNVVAARLLAPVDNSSIVFFRTAFGLIMLWEVERYLGYGWVGSEYIDPQYLFPYVGFEWVQPWPGIGMYLHFYALPALAVCIAVGFAYRISMTLFFLGITYVFLLDKAHYLNHMYLVCLISFLMIFIPANREFSVDAMRRPSIRSNAVPTWALVLLATQVAIVYIYGGFAKLNGDWLRGEPMRTWLADETDLPIVGRWVRDEWFVYFVSDAGLLLDLFIIPFLLLSKTRWLAVIALVIFHRFNAAMFSIGIFPMFATAAIVLLLPPDLPRRIATSIRSMFSTRYGKAHRSRRGRLAETPGDESLAVPFTQRPRIQQATVALVVAYLAIQLLLPLRHYLYPGNTAWTDQQDRFSWRMMLHSKVGEVAFEVIDPQTGETWLVEPRTYLSSFQASAMRSQPDMMLQFSHFLADEWQRTGYDNIEVRAQTMISLNARDRYPIVDPTVDLAAESLSIGNADWITSLEEQERLAAAQPGQDGPQSEQQEEEDQQLQN
ncbi:MAG: HTTM domain-containing protein [Chloroflexia bacterium]|nr:HTTM domain-containing protein [Chloroflexia bacterium]